MVFNEDDDEKWFYGLSLLFYTLLYVISDVDGMELCVPERK